MQIKFPCTIAHGGEKITFLGIRKENGIDVLDAEVEAQPNAGPPMHTHHRQDECFTILSGTMAYQIAGENEKFAQAGETVLIKAGVPHKFRNAGVDLLKCRGYVSPPENFVYFLSEIYKSMAANNGRPGMYDGAYLLNRYKSEYSMDEIPSFVQKFIFPIVLLHGKLIGKNKKFAGAPDPVIY